MASQGPIIAGTGLSIGSTGSPWSNPGNITANDNTYATATISGTGPAASRNTLPLTGSAFGFSIPTSATIQGVEVSVRGLVNTPASVASSTVTLYKDATITGGNTGTSKTTLVLTTSNTTFVLGASNDLWGATLSPSDINATNFGAGVAFGNVSGATANLSIDAMWITVYYTVPTGIMTNVSSMTNVSTITF